MRVESAASAKGKMTCSVQMVPRSGTAVRTVYDLLKTAPGYPVQLPRYKTSSLGGILESLRNFYGLDVRPFPEHRSHDGPGAGKKRYWLVGEWFGKTYVDYVADRRAKEEREARKT